MKIESTQKQIISILERTEEDFTSLGYVTNEVVFHYKSVTRVMKKLIKLNIVESFENYNGRTHYRLVCKKDKDCILDYCEKLTLSN